MKRWERPGTDEVDPVIPMSMDEYLGSRFRPDMDYYRGAARERNRALWPHSETMGIVSAELERQAELCGYHGLMSCRIRVSADAILVPDLCLVNDKSPREDVLITPPALCVEILEEVDSFQGLHERVALFRGMGVTNIWLIEERGQFAYCVTERGFDWAECGVLRMTEPAIEIALGGVFAELDEN